MQRLQGFGRLAGGKFLQFRGGGGQRGVGFEQLAFGGFDFLFALRQVEAPLALGLAVLLLWAAPEDGWMTAAAWLLLAVAVLMSPRWRP